MKQKKRHFRPRHNRALLKLLNIPVGKKLVLIYFIAIFLPLFLSSFYFTLKLMYIARFQENSILENTLDVLVRSLEKELDQLNIVSQAIIADSAIYRFMQREYRDLKEYYEVHREFLKPTLEKYTAVFDIIGKIIIFVDNPAIGVSSGYVTITTANRYSLWYQELNQHRDRSIVASFIEDDSRISYQRTSALCLFRYMNNPFVLSPPEMILRIEVNRSVLQRILQESPLKGHLMIREGNGQIIASIDTEINDRERASLVDVKRDLSFPETWYITGDVALQGTALAESFSFNDFILITVISTILSLMCIYLFSFSVTSRIKVLSRYMRKVEQQDFSPIEVEYAGKDEIGELMNDFNIMSQRIGFLINQVYRGNLERNRLILSQKQAELKNLQSQVNPHFLNNVLESIRMRSVIKDEKETAEIMLKLSRLFRRMLAWDEDLIDLDDELLFTREYLEIQKYRFDEHISFSITENFTPGKWTIPKMTVQGIVENACIHGIENKKSPGSIAVNVSEEGGNLEIQVNDDGVGFDLESSEYGTGIRNIRERLKLHFREKCVFEIKSSPETGTAVRIVIPGRKKKKQK
ncbi:MAG: sensor histidine kinase [Spirochaetales bacterium]|nr:sensor histidine kinase [Spirochaetales bacterium]